MCHTHNRTADQIPIRILYPRKNVISREVTVRVKTPLVCRGVISSFFKEEKNVTSPYKKKRISFNSDFFPSN